MSRVIVSAPGKIILHGEHAVVYGKSAVAFSVGLRTKVEIDVNKDSRLKIVIPNIGIDVEWSLQQICEMKITENEEDNKMILLTNEWKKCLKLLVDSVLISGNEVGHISLFTFLFLYFAIFKKYKCSYLPLHVNISSQLPIGAGLGSSASYSVCVAASLLAICGKISPSNSLTDEQLSLISNWAFEAEKIIHGKPSGIDNSVCTYGGALLFKNGEIFEKLSLIPPFEILLINTKISRNTKVLVADLRKRYDKHEDVISHVITAINCISEKAWKMLKEYKDQTFDDSFEKLQELLTINHHLLNALGVSHPQLDRIVEIAMSKNLGAKLTGAGGGGCAFILLSITNNTSQWQKEQKHVLQQILYEKGFECWDALIGCPGVLFH